MAVPAVLTPLGIQGAGLRRGVAMFFPVTANYTIPASGWYRLSALGADDDDDDGVFSEVDLRLGKPAAPTTRATRRCS